MNAEEELKALADGAKGKKVNFLKLDEGTTKVRILPGTYGQSKKLWVVPVAQHWCSKGGKKFPITCTKEATGECCFCEANEAFKAREQELKDKIKLPENKEKADSLKLKAQKNGYIAGRLWPNTSYLINVHSRKSGSPRVELLSAPKTLFNSIINVYTEDGRDTLLDVHTGYDFRIQVTKNGQRVDYNVSNPKQPEPLSADAAEIEDILGKRYDLDAEAQPDHTPEEMESILADTLEKLEADWKYKQDTAGESAAAPIRKSSGGLDEADEIPMKHTPKETPAPEKTEAVSSARTRLQSIMSDDDDT